MRVAHADGESMVQIKQRKAARVDRMFEPVGSERFEAKTNDRLTISNDGNDGYVIVDAIQILKSDLAE